MIDERDGPQIPLYSNPKMLMKNILKIYVAALAIMVGLTAVNAQTETAQFQNIKIKNFGQMDTNYFRGGQPKEKITRTSPRLG